MFGEKLSKFLRHSLQTKRTMYFYFPQYVAIRFSSFLNDVKQIQVECKQV